MLWLALVSLSNADDLHCPEPVAPEFRSVDVECSDGTIELDAVIGSEGALASVTAQVLPLGNYPGYMVELHLDSEVIGEERTSVYQGALDPLLGGLDVETLCFDHLEVRFRAVDSAGQPGSYTYQNIGPLLQNASYENGLDNWGWGGNADVVWGEENQISPVDGTGMVKIGWPTNATTVGGYVWQPLGVVPRGTYTLHWQDAVATHRGNWPDDASCADSLPLFNAGIMRNEGSAFEEVETQLFEADEMWCEATPVAAAGYRSRVDWIEREITFEQDQEGGVDDLYLFFSVSRGLGHEGHLTYLDQMRLTGDFLPEACKRNAHLNPALPIDGGGGRVTVTPLYTQLPSAITPAGTSYYAHGEVEGLAALETACVSDCTSLDGGYGGSAGNRPHGFDGVLEYADGSVLLAEAKSSSRVRSFGQWADTPSATVFEDGNQTRSRGLMNAMAHAQSSSSDTMRLMCSDAVQEADGSYRKRRCMQLHGLWNAAVVSQICLNDSYDANAGVGAVIEDAWDAGVSCTTWVGYHERVCRDSGTAAASWTLVWGQRSGESGAFTPVPVGNSCDAGDPEHCLLRWHCSSDASGYAQGTQPADSTTLHASRTVGGVHEDVLATLVLQDPQWAPNKPDENDGFWTYLDSALGRPEGQGQRICSSPGFAPDWDTAWDTGL